MKPSCQSRVGAAGLVAALLLCAAPGRAQELEPRAYSANPIGTNFALIGAQRSSGEFLPDPTLPVTDVRAAGVTATLGYQRTFALLGRNASLGFVVPHIWLDASGNVGGEGRERSITGLGDPRLRLAVGLAGGAALTPAQFAQRVPQTTTGVSLTVIPPLGEYDPARLVNIGSNRWSFKPEFGVSVPWGNAFFDAAAGVWLFTDNTDFFGGRRREQDPLWSFQAHGGYTFRPGLWLAADATYFTGGRTTVDGEAKRDLQSNSRYGMTFSYPLTTAVSLKVAYSTGLSTRVGGDFDTWSLFLQYRWFDGAQAGASTGRPRAATGP